MLPQLNINTSPLTSVNAVTGSSSPAQSSSVTPAQAQVQAPQLPASVTPSAAISSSSASASPDSVRSKKAVVLFSSEIDKTDALSRELASFTLQNLSDQTIDLIKNTYTNFGLMIEKYALNEHDLEYILQASTEGHYLLCSKYTPNLDDRLKLLADFRAFLISAAHGEFPADFQQNIEPHAFNLEGFMSAIGYSCIGSAPKFGPPWVKKKDDASENLAKFLNDMKAGPYAVPAIDDPKTEGFPKKKQELAKAEDMQGQEVIKYPSSREEASQYLESLGGEKVDLYYGIRATTQTPLPGSEGQTKIGLTEKIYKNGSYIAKAIEDGIPMRAHASGSIPLTLGGMEFINSLGNPNNRLNENDAAILAGVFILTYEASGFHSFAEAVAGICHYEQMSKRERIYVNNSKPAQNQLLDDISPKNYLAIAMGFLNRIIAEDKLVEFTERSQEVLDQVKGPAKLSVKQAAEAPIAIEEESKEDEPSMVHSSPQLPKKKIGKKLLGFMNKLACKVHAKG